MKILKGRVLRAIRGVVENGVVNCERFGLISSCQSQ